MMQTSENTVVHLPRGGVDELAAMGGIYRRAGAALDSLLRRRDGDTKHHLEVVCAYRPQNGVTQTDLRVTVWSADGDHGWGEVLGWHATAELTVAVGSDGEVRIQQSLPWPAHMVAHAADPFADDESIRFAGAAIAGTLCRWLAAYYGRAGIRHGLRTGQWIEAQPAPVTLDELAAEVEVIRGEMRAARVQREQRETQELMAFRSLTSARALRLRHPTYQDAVRRHGASGVTQEDWDATEVPDCPNDILEDWERELLAGASTTEPRKDTVSIYTLVSALVGDGDVPGVDVGELEAADGGSIINLEDLRRLLDLPEAREFFAENNYDQEHPEEVMHLVAGELTSGRYPTLTVTLEQ